jgi:putative oxidoreductase
LSRRRSLGVDKIRMKNKWDTIYLLLRVLMGLIFIWASWDKLLDPVAFAKVVYNYQIIPSSMVNLVAIILPWIELTCGLLLILGLLTKGSVFMIDSLLFIFILALGFNLYRGFDIRCGCFTLSQEADNTMLYTLIRDVGLLIPGLWLLLYNPKTDLH